MIEGNVLHSTGLIGHDDIGSLGVGKGYQNMFQLDFPADMLRLFTESLDVFTQITGRTLTGHAPLEVKQQPILELPVGQPQMIIGASLHPSKQGAEVSRRFCTLNIGDNPVFRGCSRGRGRMLVRLSVHLLDKFVGVATVMILEGNIYEPVLAGLVVEEGEI